MGNGTYSVDDYRTAAAYRAKNNIPDMTYSDTGATKTHADLDPKGLVLREARDSDEHPNSVPIAVLFDVTGSMDLVPRIMQQKLPALFDLLQRRGIADPQVLFGGIGDATCDRAPLQLGQFESDNRSDEQLRKLFLEGGGGGQKTESYEMGLYFAARKTALDCYEKRGRKGYLFIIGDEMPYPQVETKGSPYKGYKAGIAEVIGDKLDEPIRTETILAEAQEKFNVFFIMPAGTSHFEDTQVIDRWRKLLGQNFIRLDDAAAICETIATAVILNEHTLSLEEAVSDLAAVDATNAAIVSKALADLPIASV
jgi:hypothetical protein